MDILFNKISLKNRIIGIKLYFDRKKHMYVNNFQKYRKIKKYIQLLIQE